MTWKLIHDSETFGEWSDDLIDKTVKKLMDNGESSLSRPKGPQDKITIIVAEFLPDPIREALLNLHE
jgi:hypothetical protein